MDPFVRRHVGFLAQEPRWTHGRPPGAPWRNRSLHAQPQRACSSRLRRRRTGSARDEPYGCVVIAHCAALDVRASRARGVGLAHHRTPSGRVWPHRHGHNSARAAPGKRWCRGGHLFSLLVECFGVNGPRPVVVRSPGDIRQSTDAFRRRVRCGSRRAARSGSGRGVGRCASGPARVRQRGGLCTRWRLPASIGGATPPVVAVSGLSLRKGKVGVGWRSAERLLSARRAAQAGRGRPLRPRLAAARLGRWRNAPVVGVSGSVPSTQGSLGVRWTE